MRTGIVVGLVLSATVLVAFAGQPVGAQPSANPPAAATPASTVSVTETGGTLRSGPSKLYYSVMSLKPGATLTAYEQSGDFIRVDYPAGSRAQVNLDEADLSADGKTAKLKVPSRLFACSADAAPRGSYMKLLTDDLPAGTTLDVIEVYKDDAGKPIAAAVKPPAGAKAYIAADDVKGRSGSGAAKPIVDATKSAEPKAAEATKPEAPKSVEPKPADTKPAEPKTAETPPPPSKVIGATPSIGGNQTPSMTPPSPVAETPAANPNPSSPAPVAVPPADAPKPAAPVSKLEALAEMYKRTAQPGGTVADAERAIAEFTAYSHSLGETAVDKANKQSAARYVKALETLRDLRRDMEKAAAGRTQVTTRVEQHTATYIQMQSQRQYTIIGRLYPSTVYDGNGLPLLYRIESPEAGSARTLGYLQPDDRFDLTGKLGVVVGVEGESRFDDALKANLISPRYIDQISLEPVSGKIVKTESLMKAVKTIEAKPADGAKPADKLKPAPDINK